MKRQDGFTIIEMMIVVAIIGILATLVLPAYSDYVTRGKLAQASAGLSAGRVRMEQYYQDHPTAGYVNAAADLPCPFPESSDFTFTCSGLAKDTYLITATGKGSLSDFIYTINQSNTKSSQTRWGNSGTCWVIKKGGGC